MLTYSTSGVCYLMMLFFGELSLLINGFISYTRLRSFRPVPKFSS